MHPRKPWINALVGDVAHVLCVECGVPSIIRPDPIEFEQWCAGDIAAQQLTNLSADQREVLISGTCPACFARLVGPPAPVSLWAKIEARCAKFFAQDTRKVVINASFGGWSVYPEIAQQLGWTYNNSEVEGVVDMRPDTYLDAGRNENDPYDLARRCDPRLIALIESGVKAGRDLAIVELPANVDFRIHEYDGNEHIAEKHRTWHA